MQPDKPITLAEAAATPGFDPAAKWGCEFVFLFSAAGTDGSPFGASTPPSATETATFGSAHLQKHDRKPWAASCLLAPVMKGTKNPFPAISVGRARNNDLQIDDWQVSKVHAYVIPPAPSDPVRRWTIRDADSTNGTFVNDHRVGPGEEFGLNSGDSVQFAQIVATVVLAADVRELLKSVGR